MQPGRVLDFVAARPVVHRAVARRTVRVLTPRWMAATMTAVAPDGARRFEDVAVRRTAGLLATGPGRRWLRGALARSGRPLR